jgi:hypothetical protein
MSSELPLVFCSIELSSSFFRPSAHSNVQVPCFQHKATALFVESVFNLLLSTSSEIPLFGFLFVEAKFGCFQLEGIGFKSAFNCMLSTI